MNLTRTLEERITEVSDGEEELTDDEIFLDRHQRALQKILLSQEEVFNKYGGSSTRSNQ